MKYKDVGLGVRVITPHGPGKIVGYPSIIHKLRDYYEGRPERLAGNPDAERPELRIEVQLDGVHWLKGRRLVPITQATTLPHIP